MNTLIVIGQIIVALAIAGLILLQAKGTGLGATFGGGGEFYRSRRGIEKFLFILTIILAIIFLLINIAGVLLS